jgi:hypothetical protein
VCTSGFVTKNSNKIKNRNLLERSFFFAAQNFWKIKTKKNNFFHQASAESLGKCFSLNCLSETFTEAIQHRMTQTFLICRAFAEWINCNSSRTEV